MQTVLYISATQCHTAGMNTNPQPDSSDKGDFVWLTTGAVITNDNWKPGQPNRGQPNDICLILVRDWGFKWADSPCDSNRVFVCEL